MYFLKKRWCWENSHLVLFLIYYNDLWGDENPYVFACDSNLHKFYMKSWEPSFPMIVCGVNTLDFTLYFFFQPGFSHTHRNSSDKMLPPSGNRTQASHSLWFYVQYSPFYTNLACAVSSFKLLWLESVGLRGWNQRLWDAHVLFPLGVTFCHWIFF